MNEVSMDQQDLGYALTPEQQRLLEQLPKAPACGDALHFLEVEIRGALDPQRVQGALDSVLAQQPMLDVPDGAVLPHAAGQGAGFPWCPAVRRGGGALPAERAGAGRYPGRYSGSAQRMGGTCFCRR